MIIVGRTSGSVKKRAIWGGENGRTFCSIVNKYESCLIYANLTAKEKITLMSIREKMKAGLTAAIKARDKDTMNVLRSVLGTIDNAEAVPVTTPVETHHGRAKDVPRKVLHVEDLHAILNYEINERTQKSADYQRLGKIEEAERLHREAVILEQYRTEDAS